MTHTKKTCRICGEEKYIIEYYDSSSRTRDGLRHECKTCVNKKQRGYYIENKEYLDQKNREGYYKRKYKLTLEEIENLKKLANYKCEICYQDKPLVIDHCHKTGKIRGILCNQCNQALGSINESIMVAAGLQNYIIKRC